MKEPSYNPVESPVFNRKTDYLMEAKEDLKYHNILWFAYRTKHMHKWPTCAQVCYYDGYMITVFIGTDILEEEKMGTYNLEFRAPMYLLDGDKLTIKCFGSYPNN